MQHLERQTDRQEGLAAAYQQVAGEVSRALQATSTANRRAAAPLPCLSRTMCAL